MVVIAAGGFICVYGLMLFKFALAAMGFDIGFVASWWLLSSQSDSTRLLISLVAGAIGAIDDIGRSEGIVITSFEPEALALMKAARPELPRALIGNWDEPHMFATAAELEVSRACMRLSNVTPEIVARAKDAGYHTTGWPCNDEDAVRKVLELGFDSVCTDAPRIFGRLLGTSVNDVEPYAVTAD